MTSKTMIQKEEVPECIGLIEALFWVGCKVLIRRQDNGYNLNGDSLIRWWAKLLGVDTSEYDKYSKYLTHEICNNFRLTQEKRIGRQKAFNFNKTIYKRARKKLKEVLKVLIKNGISLYGIEYKNGKQQNTRHKQIPVDNILLKNIDIGKETLSHGESIYYFLRVSTDELFQRFPGNKVAFSKKTLLSSATGAVIFDTEDIKNGKLGGRPEVLSEQAKQLILSHIEINGGIKWFQNNYVKVQANQCVKLLGENKIDVCDETVRKYLLVLKRTIYSVDKK